LVIWDHHHQGPGEFLLLSARHVVAEARDLGARIDVEAHGPSNGGDRFAITPIPIPGPSWRLAPDDDLAVAPFPTASLSSDHLVAAIPIDLLTIATPDPTPDVELVGRWGLSSTDNVVITRRGVIATPERPTVRLWIGNDVEAPQCPVYLVDAFVTRGMSGGAVFQGTNPTTVLGIISAHAKLPAPRETWASLPESVVRAVDALWDAIAPINAGLVYVIPIPRVVAFLRVGSQQW
jgi:hypothetical protein